MKSNHRMEIETSVILRDAMGNIKLKKVLPPNIPNVKPKRNTIDVIVRSKNGVIVKEYNDIPMNSYVNNLIAVFSRMINIGTYGTQKSLTNSNQNVSNLTWADPTYGAIGKNMGILVGTDTTSVDVNQYTLAGLIAHGNSAGQLYRNANQYIGLVTEGNDFKLSFSRLFSNNSGGTITIRECALATFSVGLTGQLSETVMCARDILNYQGIPINISLTDSQTVQFIYNLYLSFLDGCLSNMSKRWAAQGKNSITGLTVKDTDGDSVALGAGSTPCYWGAPLNENTWGFQVGTGDTAPTMDDYQMATKIVHGTGAGQMIHGALDVTQAPTISGQVAYFTIGRTFTNSSGGDITVKEMGVVEQNNTNARVLQMRKLTGNLLIQNGAPIQVVQRFAITAHD